MSSMIRMDMESEGQSPKARTWFGTFHDDVADVTDFAEVILPDFDAHLVWGGCRWQTRDDINLPNKGDECLVTFDNRNQPWVIAWWPFS